MLEEMEHNLKSQGIDFEDYLRHLKKTRQQMLLDFAPAASKRIKGAVLFREAANRHHLHASYEEIDQELKRLSGRPLPENPAERRQYLANIITSRKVMDFLKSQLVKKAEK